MLVVYDSMTGNVKKFVEKTGMRNLRISKDLIIKEPFVLVTYTIKFGELPKKSSDFLENNHEYLRAVASSGNRNWGNMFGKAANIVSSRYGVPIILKFELGGTTEELEKFKQGVLKIEHS